MGIFASGQDAAWARGARRCFDERSTQLVDIQVQPEQLASDSGVPHELDPCRLRACLSAFLSDGLSNAEADPGDRQEQTDDVGPATHARKKPVPEPFLTGRGQECKRLNAKPYGWSWSPQAAGTDGCVSETGSGGTCADGRALDGARSVVVSPDVTSVYVGSAISDAVAAFARTP
jgi:hypothetical protein